jgi:hypothetical protein
MVNLISNEPKTGCYLLLILSNLQAPIFKNNARNAPFPVRLLGPLGPLPSTPVHLRADTPTHCLLLAPGFQLVCLPELPICIFPPNAAC